MSGQHRVSARRRAFRTATVAATAGAGVLLAVVIAFALYVLVTGGASLVTVAIVLESVAWCLLAARLGWHVVRMRPRTAAGLAAHLDEFFGVLSFTLALTGIIGQRQGWLRGPWSAALTASACLLLAAISVYWLGGKRRLEAALAARARPGT
jgi:hypothetical protein